MQITFFTGTSSSSVVHSRVIAGPSTRSNNNNNNKFSLVTIAFLTSLFCALHLQFAAVHALPVFTLEKPLPEPIMRRGLSAALPEPVLEKGRAIRGSLDSLRSAASETLSTFSSSSSSSNSLSRRASGTSSGEPIDGFGTGIRRPFGRSRRVTEGDLNAALGLDEGFEGGKEGKRGGWKGLLGFGRRVGGGA